MSGENQSSHESLARRLSEAVARRTASVEERRGWLLARRAELLSVAAGPAAPGDDLARRAAALEDELARRRGELAALEETLRALTERESRLDEALAATFGELCVQAEEELARLPLLAEPALGEWLAWLEDWHRASLRPFEPETDWQRHFQARTTVDEAMSLVDPVLDRIRHLEAGKEGVGLGGVTVESEVRRQETELHALEAGIAERLAAVSQVYGRIAADLPDPSGADSLPKLERFEGLLLSLETTLGRFAASARLERQMLEAL